MARDVAGKRVTVAGAARGGIAAAALLATKGAKVTISDLRERVPEAEPLRARQIAIELGGHRPATFASADLVVLSPGVPPDQPAVDAARAHGVPIVGELEMASWWLRGRIVAITGEKGECTTTALTGRLLQASGRPVTVGGNIGEPLSAQVASSTADTLHVVEASSFQLEQIETFRPWIAVMLNFSPDHLDRHPTLEAYGRAKARIFENQQADDWAVINADDPAALELARTAHARRRYFARDARLDDGIVAENGWISDRQRGSAERLIPIESVRLIGPHLLYDVLAAAAVGRIAALPASLMTEEVSAFRGLEH